jgi:CheY-like chemotaxis protein
VTAATPCQVLVVEDHPQVRDLISAVLSANGFTVSAVADMAEATTILCADHTFDLVLTDVRLPEGRNGIELADWIAATVPTVTVMLMSALSDASLARYHFVQKPFTEAELLQAIAAALAQGEAAPASRPPPHGAGSTA